MQETITQTEYGGRKIRTKEEREPENDQMSR